MSGFTPLHALPTAHGSPVVSGTFKSTPADFQVSETLGYEPEGQGEHLWLRLRKRGENTAWLAQRLATAFEADRTRVAYAGLKDRQAIAEQWFSVKTAADGLPDGWLTEHPGVELLASTRHRAAVSRKDVLSNRFEIRLRQVEHLGDPWEARLSVIAERGVPNYFGPQRFGHGGENLRRAADMFAGERINDRFLRGIYLSAARSALFNEVLARRVGDACWDEPLSGEALITASGGRMFLPWPSAPAREQLANWKLHPSGPLYGKDDALAKMQAGELEAAVLSAHGDFTAGLDRFHTRASRRALRMRPTGLSWRREDDDLVLVFSLASGEYATSLLREFAVLRSGDA